jgi:hypothetical protein
MKILLSEINKKIQPYKISKRVLSDIVADLFSKLNACYNHELSHIVHKDKREQRLCEIVHTHCFNGTATTKKAVKSTLKKYLSTTQYNKFGSKLLYAILDTGVDITSDKSILLIEESKFMNVDPKLEAIAMKVMDKMDLSKNDKYGNIIVVIMIIGIVLSLIRVIQECNKQQFTISNKDQKAKYMHEQVRSICISRSFLNKWRLRRIIKEKLNSEDYKLYANKLRDAILDTGVELTEDESYTLVEAANV